MTRHHRGFTCVHPSGLPLACSRWMEQQPLGVPPELRTLPLPATHVRTGTGHRTRTRTTPPASPTSNRCSRSTRATSCRTASSSCHHGSYRGNISLSFPGQGFAGKTREKAPHLQAGTAPRQRPTQPQPRARHQPAGAQSRRAGRRLVQDGGVVMRLKPACQPPARRNTARACSTIGTSSIRPSSADAPSPIVSAASRTLRAASI